MQDNNYQKPERHFTGFYKQEVDEAKGYSGYLLFISILILLGQAIAPYGLQFDNPDWYAGTIANFAGRLIALVLIGLLVAWVIRSVVKLFSAKTPNRYDYFTMTVFIFMVGSTVMMIDEANDYIIADSLYLRWWLEIALVSFVGYKLFWFLKKRYGNKTDVTRSNLQPASTSSTYTIANLQLTSKYTIIGLFGLTIVIGGVLFWWYEIRPVQIKKECSWVEQTRQVGGREETRWVQAHDRQYQRCLRNRGILE